jgi:hypothetical protein
MRLSSRPTISLDFLRKMKSFFEVTTQPKRTSTMISTLKNFLRPLKNMTETTNTLEWYLTSLAASTAKHSLEHASDLSDIHGSQFSRLLSGSKLESELILSDLSKKGVKILSKIESDLTSVLEKLPWKVYVIIDSTPQKRSASKAENVSRFNLGGGFWFGHRWTNVVLLINGHLIPLVPISYRSKNECKRLGLGHKTENELICEYLDRVDISAFIPGVSPEEVGLLLDAGYDAKTVQNKILSKGWTLLAAIGSDRNIFITHSNPSHYGNQESEIGVVDAFRRFNRRAKKITCRLPKLQGQKKRKTFTVNRIQGVLKGVRGYEMAILKSKTKRQNKVKYIACSKSDAPTWKIVQAFSLRFLIEQFHKEIKQYFGFEDVASQKFDSVISHVNFVYVVHILVNILYRDKRIGMKEKQMLFTELLKKKEARKLIQLSTRFNQSDEIRKYFKEKYGDLAA